MTKKSSFKRRIRERMTETGERHTVARSAIIPNGRPWVSDPEVSDEAVKEATGQSWNEWVDLIEAWPGHGEGHTAIAKYLNDEMGVDHWWAQSVTVGFERITGLRLPYQRPDGTFTASKSKIVEVDDAMLRSMMIDDYERPGLFPGKNTELVSKPGSKAIRVKIGPGVAMIALEARSDGRTKITVGHEKLPALEDVEPWKAYWAQWFDAIGG